MERTPRENRCVDAYGIDLHQPLLPQVAALGDRYVAWVHEPVRKTTLRQLRDRDPGRWPGTVRIFAADRLEALTHISWRLVLAVWVPVVVALLVVARAVLGLGWLALAGTWCGGLLLWTLVEYLLHRFFFHAVPRGPLAIKVHFLAHGVHHYDPFDGTRLVFPPPAGLAIAAVLYLLCELLLPTGPALALMAGLLTGYLLYDLSHYVSHHGKIRDPWFRFLHRYHAAHHHRDPDARFGVSNPLWDLVFRTGSPRI
ncbi:MAG: sterol desaturase family protein [Krumholzibacteria bacterium]|nr:sterol desaturase family protein [Candidatus Krumholzibacteria bacterium]